MRKGAVWLLAISLAVVPLLIAATSPLNEGRDLVWIAGGLAGAAILSLLLFQPLLVGGWLPGPGGRAARRWHRRIGAAVVVAAVVHVGGLYLVSPEDVVDALVLASPTPFALYGVIALWGVALTALLAALRSRLGLSAWRVVHTATVAIVAACGVAHALLIDGVMGETSKLLLCVALIAATAAAALRFTLRGPPRSAARRRAGRSGTDAAA